MVLALALGAALGAGASAVLPLFGRRVAEASIGRQRSQALEAQEVRRAVQFGRQAARNVEESKVVSAQARLGFIGGAIARFGSSIPGVRTVDVQQQAAFREAVERELRQKGYSVQQAKQISVDAYYSQVQAPDIGEAGAAVGLEFSSEVGGRALAKRGIEAGVTKIGGTAAGLTAKQAQKVVTRGVLPGLLTFGAIEGAGESVAAQLARGREPTEINPLEVAQAGLTGAFTAGLLGTFIARTAVTRPKGAIGLERGAELFDPGEVFGDVPADVLRIAETRIPVRVTTIVPTPTTIGGAIETTQAQAIPSVAELIAETQATTPTPIPTPTTTPSPVPSTAEVPSTIEQPTPMPTTTTTPTPTPTPVPIPEPTFTPTPVPAPTPAPATTSVSIPIPTVTPVNPDFPLPLMAPVPPGEFDAGRAFPEGSRFYDELRAARRLARRLI